MMVSKNTYPEEDSNNISEDEDEDSHDGYCEYKFIEFNELQLL